MHISSVLVTAFCISVLIQLYCVVFNVNKWPFVAQNMFAHRYRGLIKRMVIVLYRERGNKCLVLPGDVIPVAFFRAQRVLLNVYTGQACHEDIERFSRDLLHRLNYQPWPKFDEINKSAVSLENDKFIAFKIYIAELDLAREKKLTRSSTIEDVISKTHLFCEYHF